MSDPRTLSPSPCATAHTDATPARPRGVFIRLRQCLADRSGVGAIEFAILAPILIAAYISCVELTIGLSFAKRATRAAATVGDLVAQKTSVDKTFLASMLPAAKSIFVPYSVDRVTKAPFALKITGVSIDSAGNPTVAWSWQQDGARPYVVNSAVDVPSNMRVPGAFLVHAELTAAYPMMMFLPTNFVGKTGSIVLNREIFYLQRDAGTITCPTC